MDKTSNQEAPSDDIIFKGGYKMRKVLSFVLVLALVLGSFSFAFGLTDIEDSANKDAIKVCNDLGIIDGYPDGTFQGDKAVNRAEFAKMITVALGVPDSALAGYATTSFKDVAGYGWAVPYLAFCESKGIMLGDGMGNAMPGRTISVNEAITMALRAVGYTENSAMLVGTWPSNYVTLGQQQGLYTDLATATTIDRANAAQVIYNALTVTLVTVNADGQTTDVTNVAKDTMLEAYLDCTERIDGVLGVDYDFDDASINIVSRIGEYGTPYTSNDDGKLVAFKSASVALTGSVDGTKFVADDVEYKFSVKAVADRDLAHTNTLIDATAATVASITAAAGVTAVAAGADDTETVTIFVDLSGTTIKEVYSVVYWMIANSAKATASVQDDIADGELLANDFVTNDDDEIVGSSYVLKGADSLDDIKKGDVVYVYTDGTDIRQVLVGTEVVTGTVSEVFDGTGVFDDYVIVDGTKYYGAKDSGAAKALPSLDDEVTLYLDYFGDVFAFDATGTSSLFAVVANETKVTDGSGTAFAPAKVELYTVDDKKVVYSFSETDSDDITWEVAAATGSAVTIGGLVGYNLDADGKIDLMNAATTQAAAGTATFVDSKIFKVGATFYDIAADAPVFTYTTWNTPSTWDVSSLSDVKLGTTNSGIVYYLVNPDDATEAVAFFIAAADASLDTDDVYGVINALTEVKDGTTTVQKLVGFADGTEFTYTTDANGVVAGWPAATYDLYKITFNANGIVSAATNTAVQYVAGTSSGYVTTGALTVTAIDNDNMAITVTYGGVTTAKYAVDSDAVVYKWNSSTSKYEVSSFSKIKADNGIQLFDAKGEDANGKASIVLFW
jgi:hypothetical protein